LFVYDFSGASFSRAEESDARRMISNSTNTSPRQPWADWLLAVIFVGFVCLPTADYFCHLDWSQPPNENRVMASKPTMAKLDFPGVQSYLAGVESYFNDHFGFRKRLVRWFQHWKREIYRDEGTKAIVGQNGWLFYSEGDMVSHYLGAAQFTPAQLQAWQKLLEKRRDWLAARGIHYLFIIPPDKHNIYSEQLPAWLQNAAPTNRVTKLDQFLEYMREHSTVQILDLRRPLLAAKTEAPTYLQNDTHWNEFGAFVACQEVIKTLSKDFPDLPPLRSGDFTWTNSPGRGGDTARMLGLDAPEKNQVIRTPKASFVVPLIRPSPKLALNWDMHDTNADPVISDNPAPLNQETVVIFHDSFGGWWRPYFGASFKRVLYVWDNREFNTRVIAENHPTIVINEMLERFFNFYNPEELMSKEAVP
jgi:hypothetical protein